MKRLRRQCLLLGIFTLLSMCQIRIMVGAEGYNSATKDDMLVTEYGWEQIAPGMERRIDFPFAPSYTTSVVIIRIDPMQFDLRVHYTPGERKSSAEWWQGLDNPDFFVNAGFFDSLGVATGLVIADQQVYGTSHSNGGTIIMNPGETEISVTHSNLRFYEVVGQAAQGYPMLIHNGQIALNTQNTAYARRTMVAQDVDGNILFGVTTSGELRLSDLADYLYQSDLNIQHAFNLDGGVSTSLYIGVDEQPYLVPALTDIPMVIAGYRKH